MSLCETREEVASDHHKTLISEIQYFGCIPWFEKIISAEEVVFDVYEHFVKQTYRNRCQVLGANKILDLVVPVLHEKRKIPFKEVRIEYSQRWSQVHIGSIQSSYGKSPFFMYYQDVIISAIEKKFNFLLDLNIEILSKCLEMLQIDISWRLSDSYIEISDCSFYDVRSVYYPKKMGFDPKDSISRTYEQMFGNNFVSNLSVIDLLCCLGPESISALQVQSSCPRLTQNLAGMG